MTDSGHSAAEAREPTHDEYEPLKVALSSQFRVERELGRGGMGVVFLARDLRLDRLVAIKVLPPHLAEDSEVRERFLREARTAALLAHPNVVPVHRADEIAGFAFFIMGFIEGESLGDRVRDRGPLPPAEAVRILREVAWALAYAHSRGVVHRDIKPENILLDRASGRAMVTDFGIARDVTASPLTRDGFILGTVHYMSPEQGAGDVVDGRSDLYALGVVAFLALTGRRPFDDATVTAVLVAHATRPAPRVTEHAPHVPERVARVVERCLAKDPADRYPTGEALADALGDPTALHLSEVEGQGMPSTISADQASALWRRAAQLQAEASARLERDLTDPRVRLRSEADEGAEYRLSHVTAAAIEAGISPAFVALAVADLVRLEPSAATDELTPYESRVATRLFRTRDRSISVSRVIAASAKDVLAAIGTVFPGYPYELRLRDTVGGHPLDGGVMLFELERWSSMSGESGPAMYFKYYLGAVTDRQFRVTLRPLGGDRGGCEVTVYADTRASMKKQARWTAPMATLLAAGGGGAGWMLAAATLGGVALPIASAVVGAAAVGAGTAVVHGATYRYGIRKAVQQIDRMLSELDSSARGRSLFGAVNPPRAAPRGSSEGDDMVIVV